MAKGRSDKGFTLAELMIVVAIMGILLLIATVSYASAVSRAGGAVCASNRRTLNAAVETYYNDHAEYPATLDDLKPYVQNYASAHKCPSGVSLTYDDITHEITCPVHGD